MRIGKDKPYSKFILDGGVPLLPEKIFSDEVPYEWYPGDVKSPWYIVYGPWGCNPQGVSPVGQWRVSPSHDRRRPYTVIGFTRIGRQSIAVDEPGYSARVDFEWAFQSNPLRYEIAITQVISSDTAGMTFVKPKDPRDHQEAIFNQVIHIRYDKDVKGRWVTAERHDYGNCMVKPSYGEAYNMPISGDFWLHSGVWPLPIPGVLMTSVGLPTRDQAMDGAIREKIESDAKISKALYPEGEDSVFSALQEKALDSAQIISNNMWMFARDCINLKADFENLENSMTKLAIGAQKGFSLAAARLDVADWVAQHGKTLTKDVANVYLPILYGYGLTFQEACDLGVKLATFKRKWQDLYHIFQARARKEISVEGLGECRVNYLANLRVKENKFSQVYAGLFNSGFWLSLTDAYDFIPYSFCANWFVNVTGLLRQIDLHAFRCNLDAVSIVRSTIVDDGQKASAELWPWLPIAEGSTITVKSYNRWVNKTFDPSLFSLSVPLLELTPGTFSHYWEAGALIIQRI
jgi:hypothetical protein